MWLVTSPLDFSTLPWFILLSIDQVSAICASVTLVGQEARPAKRGAVVLMNGFFGTLGIFIAFAIGGRLFDKFGPWAPFVMVGALQLVLFLLAIAVRVAAPASGRRAELGARG